MAKGKNTVESSVFDKARAANPAGSETISLTKVISVGEEELVNLTYKVTEDFKHRLKSYFINHQPELKARGIRNFKDFGVFALEAYMGEHP